MSPIIDSHTHLGADTTYDSDRTEDELLKVARQAGIEILIVQPAQWNTYLEITQRGHDRIAAFAKTFPGTIYGMCAVNPHFEPEIYAGEVERCVKVLGFVGIKVVPHTHSWNPLTRRGRLPFEVARSVKAPLMIHTGSGLPFSFPVNLYYLAKDYPDVALVLAHAGSMALAEEHLQVARDRPNVFLETSTRESNGRHIARFVRELGAHRVMFGSDGPDEMEHNIWMVRNAGLAPPEVEWVLGKTAAEVFHLPV